MAPPAALEDESDIDEQFKKMQSLTSIAEDMPTTRPTVAALDA